MKKYLWLLIFAPLVACSGTTDIKSSLGLTKKSPDEFAVYKRPPLVVPPDFELRPPSDNNEPALQVEEREKAKAAILGSVSEPVTKKEEKKVTSPATSIPQLAPLPEVKQDKASPVIYSASQPVVKVESSEPPSTGESSFLQKAANDIDPNIKSELKKENSASSEEQSMTEQILSFARKNNSEPQVDAAKEKERIAKNKEEDKPVTEGETPIRKDNRSLLKKIFQP